MKKHIKILLLLLLILSLVTSMVACNPNAGDTDQDDDVIDDGPPIAPPIIPEKDKVFERIHNGLINAGTYNQDAEKIAIKSSYDIMYKTINLSIIFEANYDRVRKQDSEILLRIYDYSGPKNKLLIYYLEGDLYFQVGGESNKIKDFGNSANFAMFYEFITYFDLQTTFFDKEFADAFGILSSLVDNKMISVNTSAQTVSISSINLDKVKDTVNKLFETYFGAIDTKLDLLTQSIAGIDLSLFANFEINTVDAKGLSFGFSGDRTRNINIEFAGTTTTYTDDFSLKIKLGVADDVKIDPNESLSSFRPYQEGVLSYKGELFINSLNTNFDINIAGMLNGVDNTRNQLVVDVRSGSTSMMGFYYKDEKLYIDVEGVTKMFLQGGVDLRAFNLPKAYVEDINLSSEYNNLFGIIRRMLADTTTPGEGVLPDITAPDNILGLILGNVTSTKDTITLRIDDKLLKLLIGDNSASLIEFLATKLGINKELLSSLLGQIDMTDMSIELSYNVKTKMIGLNVILNRESVMSMTLKKVVSDESFEVKYPDDFKQEEYKKLNIPTSTNLTLSGEIRIQDQDKVDFSKFLGVFIGDVTGKNSQMYLSLNDKLTFTLKATSKDGINYVQATIFKNNQLLVKLSTAAEDSNIYLIEYVPLNIKYKITRDGLNQAFDDLKEGNIFTDANILQIFSVLTKHTSVIFREEDIFFTLAPYTDKGVNIDPIKELLGISNLILDAKAKISFGENPITENSNDYCVPSIVSLKNTEFESMYQAKWHETVDIMFNNRMITFQLSFLGDSAKLVTNQYYYRPAAKLLGQDILYTMILTDIVNGTKLVKELKDSKMSIDPTMESPLPDRISVWYYDGTPEDPNRQTLGSLPYEIVGFPYTKENIREALLGSKLATYEIIIGKGSIAEIRFQLPIEVLNRIVTTNEYYGRDPIVDTLTIDPYQYSIAKKEDPSYSPFSRNLSIKFGSNLGNDEFGNPIYNIVDLGIVDWDDSSVLIDYKGGEYYAYYSFNTLKVALKVIVETKEVDYIAITGEKNGEYTVDSLIASSYIMPTMSIASEDRQIRIYFKTGKYRIIGKPTPGEALPIDCDGYFPEALKWKYEVANNVNLEKTTNPLASGATNRNQTKFGDDIVGKQDVYMTVFAPSRVVSEIADPVTCITDYVLDDNEVVDSVVAPIKYSAVSFEGKKVGEFYPFDPYEKDETKRRLPSFIYINVEYAGEMVSRRYNITYIASSIVDMYGNILHPSNQQCLLMVKAMLGEDGKNMQTITMIVDNRSGIYQSVEVYNPYTNQKIVPDASGRYIMPIDPYETLKLPSKFTLIFPEESKIPNQTYDTKFIFKNGDKEVAVTQDTRFPYTGGTFLVTTYVDKNNELGILKQEFNLYIEVAPKAVQEGTIIGLLDTQDTNIKIDTYLEESNALYDRLQKGINFIGVKFKDNTVRNDIPVTWDNLNELLDVLRGYSSKRYTLVGYIYNDIAELRQKVTVDFVTEDRAIKGISFNKIAPKYLESEVLAIESDMANKTIKMRLMKPFAIEGEYSLNGEVMFGYVKPSQYLTYILSNVSITFATDFMHTYKPFFQLPANFDEMAFDGSVAETTVSFTISKMSGGSATDTFTFILITTQDKVKTTYISQNIDLFDENGAILYLDGYNISRELEVTYDKSGKIVYKNINWISQSDHYYLDSLGNRVVVHKADDKIETINRYLFNPMEQLRIEIYTKLDNGQTIVKALIFLIKDIDKTQYMAKATDGNYNVTDGTIIIDNPYAVYPFDITKLPNKITPNLTEKYGIVDYIVAYGIQWMPTAEFSTEGVFDQSKINRFVNAYANLGKKLFATAVIKGHNQNDQTIELYIDIKDVNSIKLGHDVLSFVFDNISKENFLSLDPYSDIFKEYKGNFVLPKDLKVYPNAKDSIFTAFGKDSGIKYYIYNNFVWEEISAIPYTNLGHALGENYGAADGVLTLKAVMPDSSETRIRFNVLSRDVAEVKIANYGTQLDKKYYIDPYDINTHTLPKEVDFVFRSGSNLTIEVEWEVGSAPFVNNQLVVSRDIYSGKTYTIGSRLKGYGVNEQPFDISVIIVDRSLKQGVTIADYEYDNPIAGRISDLKKTFSAADYVALPTEYASIAVPIAPYINWNAIDSDITYNGFNKTISGALSVGRISLEEVSVRISADKWVFNNIAAEQASENVIMFDPINKKSTLPSYKLYFTVYSYITGVVKTSSREVVFYPSDMAILEEQRTIIDWRLAYNSFDKMATFHIGNATKTNVIEVKNYRYQEQQLIINNKIKFQFDTEYRATGDARLVIDPFNPVLPKTVDVLAKATGSMQEVEIKNVKVSFKEDAIDAKNIFKMMLTGGEKLVTCYLTTDDGKETPFDVIVYYLNRRPETISTTNMYLSELGNVGNTYHPIKVLDNLVNNTFKTYFIINPIDRNIYDASTKTYKLPTSLKIAFDNRQVSNDINIINALSFYKKEIVLENVKWVLSREITLQGTKRGNTQIDKPIVAKISSATYLGKVFTNLDSIYDLDLNVMDKEVEYTSVSTKIEAAVDRKAYQRANREYFIDPYEPMLPTDITIKFFGEAEMLTYTDIKWTYDDSIITSGAIFTGDVDKEAMNIMASIPVFASKLEVQFPIKPRKIETSKTESGSVIPLDGGKIYVLKGVPIEEQIKVLDHLYYKFELEGSADIARVPLSFNPDDLKLILTDKPGKIFTLRGNLGRGDKGNIKFLIEVIDPIMYNINTTESGIDTEYEKGGLVYDKLTVASDSNKNYIPGREETVLPKVILANDRKEVLYIDSIKYNLNVASPYATLECSYIFLSESVKLSGKPTADGGMTNRLTMSLVMPVETYDYTRVDLGLTLEKTNFQSELGKNISTSTLPSAVNRAGTKYPLIWDLSNVNIFKAGTYQAMGYYRNTYGTIIGLELEIDIAKLRISDTDINIKSDWLNRVYSGMVLDVPVVINSVLKPDGTMGAIDSFVIEYSIDDGASWFLTQPVNVKVDGAPDYLIRVTVIDGNYVGSKTFTLRLTKKAIRAEDISFSGGDGVETRFEFNGNLQAPIVNGIPDDAEVITKFNGSTSLSPIDAGTYIMEVEFPAQRNYYSTNIYTKAFTITKKHIDYKIQSSFTYKGIFTDCIVIGLPESGVKTTYYYTYNNIENSSMQIRDAGRYRVTVVIDGGKNYVSANLTGNPLDGFSGETYNTNLINQEFTIEKQTVVVAINTVTSEYLENIKPFNSAATFNGIVGTDNAKILGELKVYYTAGTLTNKHMVGIYELKANILAKHNNYKIVGVSGKEDDYGNGAYIISANNAIIVNNSQELNAHINNLKDGQTVKWYLRAGEYGDITIDKNASVSIIGSYTPSNDNYNIAVKFNSITIEKGAVLIDIVAMNASSKKASINIKDNARSVTVNRCEFKNTSINYLTGSIAIQSSAAYKDKLYVENTLISRYSNAIFAQSGGLDIKNSKFESNLQGVHVRNSSLTVRSSEFRTTRGNAIYIASKDVEISIVENLFYGNNVGIASVKDIRLDIDVENSFLLNAINVQKII